MISLVVPIYNDGWLSDIFCSRFKQVVSEYFGTEDLLKHVELIFVNDGSKNDSLAFLVDLAQKNPFVKVVNLSRNFGQHIALTAGYSYATGDFVGMMNVDLQEDVTEFVKLVEFLKTNEDYDFILGLRKERNDSLVNKLTSKFFNKTLNFLIGFKTPVNSSTVRVMRRNFLNEYLKLTEKDRYLPALENWLGFKHAYLPVNHVKRQNGKSSYSIVKRLKMGFNAITTFSDKPIRVAAVLGLVITLLGFLMGLRMIIIKLYFNHVQPGYTSTLALIIFFSGLQLSFLGLTAIYIGKIFKEVQNRPLFIVKKTYNF